MSDFKSILKPILPLRIIAFIFQIISIGLSLAQPVLIGLLIDKINLLATPDHFKEITQLTITLIGVSILDFIVYYLKDYLFSKALYDGINLMRDHILSLALNQPISIFERNNIGDKLNKILNDSELYAKYRVYQVPSTAIILIRITAIYIILFNMSPALTGLLVVVFSIYLIIYLGINKKIRPLIGEELADYSNVMNKAQETMEGLETIKINVQEEYFESRFSESLNKYLKSKIRVQRYSSLDNGLLNFFYSIVPILILGIGAYFIIRHEITLGILIAFYSYTHWVIEPVYSLANLNRIRQQALVAFPRLKSFVEGTSAHDPNRLKDDIESIESIEIDNISFSYDNSKLIVNNLSLKLKKGSRIAITGESGTGKSTLAMIILGIIEPNKGDILVNGNSLKNINIKSYLSQCSYMPQDIFLFSGSLDDNITFEKINNDFPSDIFNKLSLEDLMNRNIKDIRELSGGEKQRIGLARSMYRMPALLIYDEPTASLDANMEQAIIKAIDEYLNEYPCIFIAITHRNAILQICDYELHLDSLDETKLININIK